MLKGMMSCWCNVDDDHKNTQCHISNSFMIIEPEYINTSHTVVLSLWWCKRVSSYKCHTLIEVLVCSYIKLTYDSYDNHSF